MSSPRIPETFLPQAPARNMSAVTRDIVTPGEELRGGTGKLLPGYLVDSAEEKLARFRRGFQAANAAPIKEIAELEVDSRSQLILEAAALFADYAVPRSDDKETMRHASLAGCGVVMAFLELTARFHAEQGRDIADDDSYRRVINKSLVTLLQFAATSREADGVLMTNVSTLTRSEIKRMSDEDIQAGLQFDESYFTLTDAGVVVLKNDLKTRKRASQQCGGNFDFSSRKYDILFGCPFRSGISRLHGAMFEAALRNDLLEAV